MTAISVSVTNAGGANVSVSNGSTVNASVGNGGAVNVAIGTISPGNATIVSGTLTINSTTTLAAGSQAYVKNDSGTPYAAKLDFGIPSGPVTLVGVGETTTLAPGSNATVTGTASGSNLTLAFGIPRGATPSFAIGNVTTGAAGSSASVVATASNSGANVTLDLTIPRGDPGTSGSNGTNGTSITLSSGTPANLGTASAGSSNLAARADHIHNLPVIAYGNLSGTPTNFPTNTTLVTGLSAGYSAANHGHNYVTALNNLTGSLTLAAGSANVTLTANGSTLTIDSKAGLDGNSVLDGGDYVGQIVLGITFTQQPQNVNASSTTTVNLTALNINANAPFFVGAGNASLVGLLPQFQGQSTVTSVVRSTDNGTTWLTLRDIQQYTPQWVNGRSAGGSVASADNGSRLVFAHPSAGVCYFDSAAPENAVVVGSAPFSGSKFLLAYNGQRFVGVAADGNRLFTSSDGVSWTKRLDLGEGSVAFAIQWVASIGSTTLIGSPSGGMMQSADGVSWSVVSVAGTLPSDVASSGSRLVGVNGTTARYSTNGTTWGTATLPVACNRISYAAGLFWAFNSDVNGTDVCTSADGVSWTLQAAPASAGWIGAAAYSNVAMLHSGTQKAAATIGQTYGSASLTVSASASGGAAVAYQWQSSADAGASWSNVANATSTTLSLVNVTSASNGIRYRAAASATGATTVFSQSATLTVTG